VAAGVAVADPPGVADGETVEVALTVPEGVPVARSSDVAVGVGVVPLELVHASNSRLSAINGASTDSFRCDMP